MQQDGWRASCPCGWLSGLRQARGACEESSLLHWHDEHQFARFNGSDDGFRIGRVLAERLPDVFTAQASIEQGQLRLRQNGNLLKVRIHRSEELAHLEGHTVDVRVMSRTLGEPTYVRVSRLALPPVLPRTPPGIVTPLRGKARKKKLGREAAQRKAR